MIYWYLALHDFICAAACVYLILNDSPWRAGMLAIGLYIGINIAAVEANRR